MFFKLFFRKIPVYVSILTPTKKHFVKPFQDSSEYDKMGIHPPKGIVIFGPSGVGKSVLSFALVNAMGLPCIYVDVRFLLLCKPSFMFYPIFWGY